MKMLLAVLFTYEEGPWASWWLDPRDDDHRKAAMKSSRILSKYREGPKQNVIKMPDGPARRRPPAGVVRGRIRAQHPLDGGSPSSAK